MIPIEELWKELKFISDIKTLSEQAREILHPILREELDAKRTKRIQYLLARSGIKTIKRLEDFDWKASAVLPREDFMKFSNSNWIHEPRNLVLIGPTGVGKTHLGDGLCHEAIKQGVPTSRSTCFELVSKLKASRNRYSLIRYYATVKVFCLDELGYVFPSQDEANDIFQIISRRSEILPTLITTNLLPSQWGKIFESSTASAILDRLSFKGTFLTLEGKSYRNKAR